MKLISSLGNILEGTVLYPPAAAVYETLESINYRCQRPNCGGHWGLDGWYEVTTHGQTYRLYLTGSGQLFRDRIHL